MIAGGGKAADEIRELDARHRVSAHRSHWDAVAAMTFNSEMLSRTHGNLPIIANRKDAETAWANHEAVLLDTSRFLRDEQAQNLRSLPESWSVTSDSIAAFVALHWPASGIVFCKSCDFTPTQGHGAGQGNFFDEWFPNLLSSLQQADAKLLWLNLRAATPLMQQVCSF